MPTVPCEKCEEWSAGYVSLLCSLLAGMLGMGFYYTCKVRLLAGVWFALLSLANLFSAFYSTCRHCYYYGKRCYLSLGLIVPHFFAKRQDPPSDVKMILWMAIFISNILYPLISISKLFTGKSLMKHALTYLMPPLLATTLISFYSCPKCKNVDCLGNPERWARKTG